MADPVIGHCDLGAWNVLAVDGVPVAFIDWDSAGPVGRRLEIAQTAWLNAQLHDEDVASSVGLPDLAARAHQLRAFCDGYGRRPGIQLRGASRFVASLTVKIAPCSIQTS